MRRRFRIGSLRRHLRSEKGQTFVMVAAAFPLIIAIAAVVIDGTRLFVAHQQTQNAADAASLAAGRDLPAGGCTSIPQTCPLGGNGKPVVQNDANQYSVYNGGPPIDHACVDASDSNCWMTPVPIRDNDGVVHSENIVQVRITENRDGLFANAIGAGNLFHVKAVAAATPGSFAVINTTPGTTSPGTTTLLTSTSLQTSTTGGAPAIMFAYGVWYPNNAPNPAACNPGGGQSINMSGKNNVFHGGVWSNGGVSNSGQNNGAPVGDPNGQGLLFYTDPCIVSKPGNWVGTINEKAKPIDWPVPLPVLTCLSGGTTVTTGTSCPDGAIATAVTDNLGNTRACINEGGGTWGAPNDLPSGVYCGSGKINVGTSQQNGAAFIAPAISIPGGGGGKFVGYPGLYNPYGGLYLDGYGPSGVQSSAGNSSMKGAIFAPKGSVDVPGGGTTLACAGSNSCGFIEAVAINFPSDGSTYQGLGPPIGGTVSTTTIVSTTTVTLPGTTSGGSTGTTTLDQDPGLRQ
jgi:hypothetical protein